jgi:myo-inositol 2-dehydrogenase/D-chiro-inositol 1-dehydrogenase
MKLCMIGCGDFARRFHGPAQQRCAREVNGLELSGCCDVDARRARAFAENFGYARPHTDLVAMLASERPDAVVLAVPPAHTCSIASEVLARGFPLLLEKPPGLTGAELARLIEAADKGRAPAQVAFNRRYMPVMGRAREILDGALAGGATRVDYEMTRYERWDADFSTTAVHAIDAVRFLAGSPFEDVRIEYQPIRRGSLETVAVSAEIRCASGLRARLEIQPVAGANTESARIHALGHTVSVKIPYPGEPMADGLVEHWSGDKIAETFSDHGLEVGERMGIVGETRAFLSAVRTGAAGSPGLGDCRQQVQLMEAIRRRAPGLNDLPAV